MKIVFLGSPDFALPSLKALVEKKHTIVAVFTQPDRPAGRGGHLQETPIKIFAKSLGLPVFTPETCKTEEAYQIFKKLDFDLGVVVAYGNILPQKILDIPSKGFINAHGSLLPLYRGASPIAAPILNGDKISGVSIQKMVKKVDAGDVYLSLSIDLASDETLETLHDKLSALAAKALLEVCEQIANNTAVAIPQEESKASFAGKLTKEMGRIDWSEPANVIDRKIRAFTPWPGSYCFANIANRFTRIKILKASLVNDEKPYTPGIIVSKDPFYFLIGTTKGSIRIYELQREGKNVQDTATFLNGIRMNYDEPWQ